MFTKINRVRSVHVHVNIQFPKILGGIDSFCITRFAKTALSALKSSSTDL